jgi:glycerol-3-phosphate acyltransferase PlsX
MAMAKFVLKTLPGIDRPAIATMMPTQTGEVVMLDLGANIECDAENVVQFALMGAIFCRCVLGRSDPTIGLLNIGTEELKGHDEVRIALKSIEGTAHLISHFLRQSFGASWVAKIGYLLSRGAFKRLKARVDPRRYNGAMFLGLQGVCVKSHGGTDAEGFANAIGVAYDLVARGFNQRIAQEVAVQYGLTNAASEPQGDEP